MVLPQITQALCLRTHLIFRLSCKWPYNFSCKELKKLDKRKIKIKKIPILIEKKLIPFSKTTKKKKAKLLIVRRGIIAIIILIITKAITAITTINFLLKVDEESTLKKLKKS